MDEAKTLYYAGHEELCLLFREVSISDQVVTQISAWVQVHHQVQVFVVLEGELHVYDKWVF